MKPSDTPSLSPRLIAIGIACLVVSSICDSLRAPLLPLLAERGGLGYGQMSVFLTAGSGGALLFTVLSARVLARLSDRSVMAAASAFMAIAMAATAWAFSLPVLAVCGIMWGAGSAGTGFAANLYVIRGSTEEKRSRALSGLHLFYGLSSMVPAIFVGAAARAGWSVRAMLLWPALLPLLLASAATLAPRGDAQPQPGPPPDEPAAAAGFRGLPPGFASLAGCLALYVTGEVLTSMWLVSYLTGAAGWSVPRASRLLGVFFLALACGRGAGALFLRPRLERAAALAGMTLGSAAIACALGGMYWAFPAAALAFGPVFPVLITRVSTDYPDRVRELLPLLYASFTAALIAGHMVMGLLSARISLTAALCFPAVLPLAAAVLFARRQVIYTAHE